MRSRGHIGPLVRSAAALALCTALLASTVRAESDADPYAGALDFLLGEWKLATWFAAEGGTKRPGVAQLAVTRVLDGKGIRLESFYPAADGNAPFRATTTYVLNPRLGRWFGSGINTLGNAKLYEVASDESGQLVVTQSGMLFRGRAGINRMTYFDIGPDRFKLRHEHSDDDGKTWQEAGFGYTASRVPR